jgi:hypothetical protein
LNVRRGGDVPFCLRGNEYRESMVMKGMKRELQGIDVCGFAMIEMAGDKQGVGFTIGSAVESVSRSSFRGPECPIISGI